MSVVQALPLATSWGMHGNGGMGTGWGIVMLVGMALFWLPIIVIPLLMLLGTVRGWPGHREDRPAAILDRRFAEGAISLEDYEERKRQLTGRTRRRTESLDAQPPPGVGVT